LIAPSSVIFFNNSWEEVGTKSSLQAMISRIAGIQVEMLSGAELEAFSVAQRISWAAKRETTRLEDLAYCLMGLFGVNMPMLYGEGERAFIRLQEEIMKLSDDHSLFAWKSTQWWSYDGGLLARSPAAFAESGSVVRSNHSINKPYALTNKGIHFQVPSKIWKDKGTLLALLDCEVSGPNGYYIGITLRRTSILDNQYIRNRTDTWVEVEKGTLNLFSSLEVYVRAKHREKTIPDYLQCHVSTTDLRKYGFSHEGMYPNTTFRQGLHESCIPNTWEIDVNGPNMVAVLKIGDTHGVPFIVILRSEEGQLYVNVEQADELESLREVFWSFNPANLTSQKKRSWRAEPDRIIWQQPNGTWVVSVAIKKQIVSGTKVQAVVISGYGPLQNSEQVVEA
jgi:hypothetical protein